ncbi:phage tail protein [Nocardia wallacei]|uniref:Gp37-like protein n=1 Tax=Nocardia wallacei TaxID=480035 RepID=UPI002458FA4C|nr:phage tail protein [Nocardia wallacei]
MPDISTLTLEEQCQLIWDVTVAREKEEARARLEPPLVRVWTGDGNLQGVLNSAYVAEFTWIDNDSGTGLVEIPLWDPLAKWIYQVSNRIEAGQKRNVVFTVDKDGARWSGTIHDHSVEKREDGTRVLVVRLIHDFELLKYYLAWCNPFLPDFVQFPRVFFLAGPSIWALKTALFLNVMREQESLWELLDDPMDQGGSAPGMSNWSVVVKPTTFMDDLFAGTLWSIPNSRFKYWVDMSKDILEDAQLSVQVRRYVADDDDQPIAGQTLRNLALVVDIVDKSGYYTDTSNGGDPFLGLKRTFAELASDFIDETIEDVIDPAVPDSYKIPGLKLTDKTCPYVIYLEGDETGIESSKFMFNYGTAVQVVTGGHSFPFVNEIISAGIQTIGDAIAAAVFIPPIGGALDAILQPLYWDTIAAWQHFGSPGRKAKSGWIRMYEFRAGASDRAFTLEALLSLRKGFHETRSWFSHEVVLRDGAPWYIGDQGKGHFFLGDRIGAQVLGEQSREYGFDDYTIYVDRVRELTLRWDEESFAEWRCVIGEKEKNKDRGQRALNMITDLNAALHNVGVLGR